MTTSYPAGLDSYTNPTGTDELDDEIGTRTHSEFHADNNDAIEAIQAELGTDPSGSEATVKARIAAAETATANHLADVADAHAATAITNTAAGNIVATTVQAAINELDTEKLAITTAATTYQPIDADLTAIAALTAPATQITDATAHISDGSAAHAASAVAFTPNGNIAATDAQAAVQEVRDDAATAVAAEAVLARNADNLTSGTVADARIASTIARDSEVAAAYQPLDADLTALAAAGNSTVLAATTASFLTADETKLDSIAGPALIPGGRGGNASFPWNGVAYSGLFSAMRFQILVPTTIRYFLWEVTATTAGNVDVGIVQLSGTDRLTYTRIVHTGNFACPADGVVRTDLGATTLQPGDYAMGISSAIDLSLRGQGSRSDIGAQRLNPALAGAGSSGIAASGTFGLFGTFDHAFALEANV